MPWLTQGLGFRLLIFNFLGIFTDLLSADTLRYLSPGPSGARESSTAGVVGLCIRVEHLGPQPVPGAPEPPPCPARPGAQIPP